jgi:hypothetical protein
MNYKEFITGMKGYFGSYPNGQRPIIAQWLKKQNDMTLEKVFWYIVNTFTPTATVPIPLVVHFEEGKKETAEEVRMLESAKRAMDHLKQITQEDRPLEEGQWDQLFSDLEKIKEKGKMN